MKLKFFLDIPIFNQWNKWLLQKFLPKFREKKIIWSQIVFKEKDPVDYIYIVKEGEFELSKRVSERLDN